MNGKQQYENIPIPDTLDSVIDNAIRCARPRVSPLWRVLAAAACFVLVLFGVANTPLYTYAADIPVIGGVVQVLRIGTGGEVTDGAELTAESEGGSVDLEFAGMSSAFLRGALLGSGPRRYHHARSALCRPQRRHRERRGDRRRGRGVFFHDT